MGGGKYPLSLKEEADGTRYVFIFTEWPHAVSPERNFPGDTLN